MAHTLRFPGFFDLQVNGFAGVDFNAPGVSEAAIAHVSSALRATGVTRFLPTLITSAPAHFAACAAPWRDTRQAAVAGLHLEGPYINPEDGPRGAHPAAFVVPPSVDDFERRQDAAGGRIRLVTLAPEMPGALALIEHLVNRNVAVAIGHSAADGAILRAAVAAGARLTTHLGNATPRHVPRWDNVIWQQLARDELLASLIVDGHHLDPDTVKVIVRAKTPARTVLVTDAMAAAGQSPGAFTLGEIAVRLTEDGRALDQATGRLAGSALTMDRAVSLLTRFAGVELGDAVASASWHPARLLGEAPRGTVEASWDPAPSQLQVLGVSDESDVPPHGSS
ncbi:MAG: amidohydrolase family protein [Myxococcales bacterium]|nr:amidohydrolase family protein [Myxococcales bacterium]